MYSTLSSQYGFTTFGLHRHLTELLQRRLYSSGDLFKLLRNDKLHEPGMNHTVKGYLVNEKTAELLQKHLKETGGQVRTRFPPEPSGALHLGHARSLSMNFGYARLKNGVCYLRFDDTNPDSADLSMVEEIKKSMKWLGYIPDKITFASDYFNQLYEWAQLLIRKDLAYICHQCHEELSVCESPWRTRPIEESLEIFEKMKNRELEEGKAILRLKYKTEQGRVDPVIYRIKLKNHSRTGSTWGTYPLYDYAHCLCDSIENITHSFCTQEFYLRRSTYYWICQAVGVYCPVQTEFGRLRLQYAVTSKRKISELISHGIISGWDDPRLLTLQGLKRRGIPSIVVNNLCYELGWKISSSNIDPTRLESLTRKYLLKNVHRVMAVRDPVKVKITNFPYEEFQLINTGEKFGGRLVKFGKEIWLDGVDFREEADSDYRRLTFTQTVGLKHVPFAIKLQKIVKVNGCIDHLEVTCHLKKDVGKQKAYIQWVSNPVVCESREYSQLLTKETVSDDNLLDAIAPESLVKKVMYVDESMLQESIGASFQFDRMGYYAIDEDSTNSKLVFNRIVDLKDFKKH